MLRPSFELFWIVTIQYSFVYCVEMSKTKPNKKKNTLYTRKFHQKKKKKKTTNTVI